MNIRNLLVLAALGLVQSATAEDRLALVIGNSAYEGDAALKNPVNDAAAVEATLKKLDFKVTKKTDLDLPQLEDAVLAFRKSLTKGSLAFFFYAGHGVQVKGENFLVPVKANVKEESQVKFKCYHIDQVLSELDESNAGLKVVILDCCRNNPFTRSWTRGGTGKGLASMTSPDGTIIAFSTAPNTLALDGRGANSPYTKHLVATLNSRPDDGLEMIQALRDASAAVREEVDQRPWLNLDATVRNYYLWRNTSATPSVKPKPPVPMPVDPPSDDKSFTNSVGMKMVLIPAGKFTMGSLASETDHQADENQVEVTLTKSFYLGQTEVTQGQWKNVMGTEPWKEETFVKEGAKYPATYVSWDEAQEFCKKLSAKEGKAYRLPTEAEWEFACRGGTTTVYSFGRDATNLGDYAWFDKNAWDLGNKHAHEVGQKKANPFGLHDMHGNVWEWCADLYVDKLPGGRDPLVSSGGSDRVVRGGSWYGTPANCRSAIRRRIVPSHRSDSLGFRVSLSSDSK